jgi:hypothetical protein
MTVQADQWPIDENALEFKSIMRISMDVKVSKGRMAEVRFPLDATREDCDLIISAIVRRKESCRS